MSHGASNSGGQKTARESAIAKLPGVVENGDFEQGLTGPRVVLGTAFAGQLVDAATINAADVEINGQHSWCRSAATTGTRSVSHRTTRGFLVRVVTRVAGVLGVEPVHARPWIRVPPRRGRRAVSRLSYESPSHRRDQSPPSQGARPARRRRLRGGPAHPVPTVSDVLLEQAWDLVGDQTGQSLIGAYGQGPLARRRHPVREFATAPSWSTTSACFAQPLRQFNPPALGMGRHPLPSDGAGWASGTCSLDTCMERSKTSVSCLEIHGLEHGNLLRPIVLWRWRWARQRRLAGDDRAGRPVCRAVDDQPGFRGWPAFDELTHLKTHQAWIRRADEGGQRLMVALVVHNEMLAALSTATTLVFESRRAIATRVEPQVQILLRVRGPQRRLVRTRDSHRPRRAT